MKSNYRMIGELVERIDIRNTDGMVQDLIGVSIDKCFIKSVANTIGTDLKKYKIISKDEFAVSLMQVSRDAKIPVTCLKNYDKAIISPAYYIFKIKDIDIILPEYLDLWFKRSEFDREAAFIAVGGVRGSMPWEEFCRIKVFVPSIEEQYEIVNRYKVITDRIALKQKINDNLVRTLDTLFNEIYVSLDDDTAVSFEELCSLASSKRVFAEDYCLEGVPFYRGKEITQKKNGEPISEPLFISDSHYEALKANYGVPQSGDILITAVGTIGNSYMVQEENFYFKDGNIIWLKNFAKEYINYYLYDYMQTCIFRQELEGICIGSTQTALTIVALSKLQLKVPSDNILKQYCEKSIVIRNTIWENNVEIEHLTLLTQMILSSLSH